MEGDACVSDEVVSLFRTLLHPIRIRLVESSSRAAALRQMVSSNPRYIDVFAGDSVKALRKRIKDLGDGPEGLTGPMLELAGRELKDGLTLSDYSIASNSTLIAYPNPNPSDEKKSSKTMSRTWAEVISTLLSDALSFLLPTLRQLQFQANKSSVKLSVAELVYRRLALANAAMCVLGGGVPVLRSGGSCIVITEGLEAKGVVLKKESGLFQVELDSGAVLRGVGADRVRAVYRKPLPIAHLKDKAKILNSVAMICTERPVEKVRKNAKVMINLLCLRRRALKVMQELLQSTEMVKIFCNKGLFPMLSSLYTPNNSPQTTADLELRTLALENTQIPLPREDASRVKTPVKKKPTEWACPRCTFVQSISNLICSMCTGPMSNSASCPTCKKSYKLSDLLSAPGAWLGCKTCGTNLVAAALLENPKPSPSVSSSRQSGTLGLSNATLHKPWGVDVKKQSKTEDSELVSLGVKEKMTQRDACFLSAVGLPEKWAKDILKAENNEQTAALRRLLKDHFSLMYQEFHVWNSMQNGSDPTASTPRRLPTTLAMALAEANPPAKNPLHHILSSVRENMAISEANTPSERKGEEEEKVDGNDTKTERYVSKAETWEHESGEFSESSLKKLDFERYLNARADIDTTLTGLYAKSCVFMTLSNLPKDDTQAMAEMAKHNLLQNFLRLYLGQLHAQSALDSPDGLLDDDMARAFLSFIKLEIPKVCAKAQELRDTYKVAMAWVHFTESAPITSQLVQIALGELVTILRAVTAQSEKKKSNIRIPKSPIRTVVWLLDVFFAGIKAGLTLEVKEDIRQHKREFYNFILPEYLLNLLVEIVIVTKGSGRAQFMQLLASVINTQANAVRIQGGTPSLRLSLAKVRQLQKFMFEVHEKQGGASTGRFSTFFQGLVELNVSIFTTLSVGDRGSFTFTAEQKWFKDLSDTAEVLKAMTDHTVSKVPEDFLFSVAGASGLGGDNVFQFLEVNNGFSTGCDSELVNVVNEIYIKKSKGSTKPVEAKELTLTRAQRIQNREIQKKGVSDQDLKWRFEVLAAFNQRVRNVLKYINLSLSPGESALTDGVRACRNIIFWSSKEALWKQAMEATVVKSGIKSQVANNKFIVKVDNKKAMDLKTRKGSDAMARVTVFGQIFQQLKNKPGTFWRIPPMHRAFVVNEAGFLSHDVGGPYRDLFSNMTAELQSSDKLLGLFIPCPNMKHQVGNNLDGRIPKPIRLETPHQLKLKFQLYQFLGKIMGLAVRSLSFLSMSLTSVVWKPLVMDQVEPKDIEAISSGSFQQIEQLVALEKKTDTKNSASIKAFDEAAKRIKFQIVGSDGKGVELVQGGREKGVTWATRQRYIEAAMEYKLNEFARQAKAIRKGLATAVPYQCLSIFTWSELRDQVCGRVVIDLKLLKSMTVYHGYYQPDRKNKKEVKCGPKSPHIRLFWDMVENKMDNKQRSELIFFVWGRSRLPLNADGFGKVRFAIKAHTQSQGVRKNPNQYYPVSHTCFFQLDLPEYTDANIMYEKFLYAMTNCKYIDGDNTKHARSIARMR
ncbi:hypothetical protein AAMO2058_000828200 [Amorphochlora amoebiformis]